MPTAPSAANRPYGDEPPPRDGADACPGALRLHSANDGALARVRIPAGLLTAAQADVLASAAERLGDARLDLTSRGNVQLRGLEPACGGELARLLDRAGLLPAPRHERVRNIVASPLSGLDGQGADDVLPWVRELDALLCASETATALSGRFLFACDDGRGDMTALDADVTILASNAAGQPPACACPAPRAATAGHDAASAHTATAQRLLGTPDAPTPQEARHAAVPPGPSGASSGGGPAAAPTVGGGSAGADAPAQGVAHRSRPDAVSALLRIAGDSGAYRISARRAARAALVVAEAFVELAGGQAWRVRELPAGKSLPPGGLVPLLAGHGIEARYESDAPAPEGPAPVPGPVSGPNGRTALSVAAPLGRLTAAQWRQLAAVAREDGDGTLRLTPWRGIVLPGLTPAAAPARLAALADAGLIVAPDDPRTGVSACTGRPGCAKSLADVRADAAAATASGGGGLPVHLSGCERRCGHPRGRWTDVLATPDGYRIAAPDGPVHHGVTPAELAGALAAARTTPATR
ncbi:nitrite reductase [Streptomyces sp. PR69]|uniref:nitrite reductase n=1 Tax=Streptomyces sp. PR69 TaxID=2984950 RepID=UPI002264D421|nr:nitrite reductase [Streptomyces sp. PR69]